MKYKITIAITSILVLGLSFYVYRWELRKPLFEVHFFSLSRGRAVFIRGPDGKTILVGGGQNSNTIRELTKVMPFYRKRIDYLVVPSATVAQIGGLLEMVERYKVGEVILPEPMSTSTVLDLLIKSVHKKKIHIQKVKKGDVLNIGDLKVEILFPFAEYKFNKSSLPELGMEIEYGETRLYLMGNLSRTIQKNIAKESQIPDGENILELYNSGIKTKVSGELIDAIKPKYIFTTKEKTTRFFSDGFSWKRS